VHTPANQSIWLQKLAGTGQGYFQPPKKILKSHQIWQIANTTFPTACTVMLHVKKWPATCQLVRHTGMQHVTPLPRLQCASKTPCNEWNTSYWVYSQQAIAHHAVFMCTHTLAQLNLIQLACPRNYCVPSVAWRAAAVVHNQHDQLSQLQRLLPCARACRIPSYASTHTDSTTAAAQCALNRRTKSKSVLQDGTLSTRMSDAEGTH
jgi:hypothetical protein